LKFIRELKKKKKKKNNQNNIDQKNENKEEEEASSMSVVVRLSVLTMFPLIESLNNIKDSNYEKLCEQILKMLIKVIEGLPTLSLHKEPSDCIDSYQNFVFDMIERKNFAIENEKALQAVNVLIGIAISRGNAKDVLLVVKTLFNIFSKEIAKKEEKK